MKKRYQVIYADPPWKYNSRANHKTKFRGGAEGHYPLMSMEEIKALPIDKMAAENCALFMWCTFPYLDKQIKLFEHWGFDYKTQAFTWIKLNPKDNKPFFGVGYYTKSNAEVCLLGIKGKMKTINNDVSSVVLSPRREHSRKPDCIRDNIVRLFGDLPRIEMFCRDQHEGCGIHGNQTETFNSNKQQRLF